MIKKFDEFIKESYNNFGLIKSKSNYYMINESQESKSQSAAIKLVMDRFGWDYQRSDKFVREDLRNDITALRDKNIAKFTLGVTRMYLNNEITDARSISDLNATLKLLTAHLNEYDRNLNGLSAEELISKFKQARENNVKKEKQEINRMKFGTSDYEIVRIDSFNDAKKYYTYTNPNSRWCLTYMENMYDSYTCDGINQIYFCLKHCFEDIKKIKEENAPLDEYGLSMLSIIVNEEGELAYCTTRWNHDNGGNDSAMDAVEISKVVNVNFYEIFKPNTKWKDIVDNVKLRLANGESPKRIFDNVYDFSEGYAKVRLNKKWNFINKNGELLSDKWYDGVYSFNDDYAKVELNNKMNFINKNGELLSDKWYDEIYSFYYGYAKVELNNKMNFIDTEIELVSDEWFDEVYDFDECCGMVYLKDKGFNFINTEGKLISEDKWYDEVYNFNDGYARVYVKNIGWNFINEEGKLLFDDWYNYAYNFEYGYARVKINDKYNFINTEGKPVFDEWFDDIDNDYRHTGYIVTLNGKNNFIHFNSKGKPELASDKWVDTPTMDEFDDFLNNYNIK